MLSADRLARFVQYRYPFDPSTRWESSAKNFPHSTFHLSAIRRLIMVVDDFAAKRRRTTSLGDSNHRLAWLKCFGISEPFCSLTGSSPVPRHSSKAEGGTFRETYSIKTKSSPLTAGSKASISASPILDLWRYALTPIFRASATKCLSA